ncbi:MAG: cobalamin-dependent protein [Clostridia bacterium]|jgi:methylmalonyl-CoA mutase C-terminal domain/subunit|nr:cobalamin-dependent protein [Clostridia bacterium]MBQ6892434.1 cobalamin-dependent protein [Clostridia bacterium]MBQ7754189.1 cobalamin-dependent protein [Clostridia bacterium]
MERKLKMRVLIAKPGLGGHDRRAKQIAQGLKEQGFEVIFTGLRQTPSQIVDAALLYEVDAVGLSLSDMVQGSLATQMHSLIARDVVLFGFGSIREEDVPALLGAGLEAVFPAESSVEDMADFLRRRCALTGTY